MSLSAAFAGILTSLPGVYKSGTMSIFGQGARNPATGTFTEALLATVDVRVQKDRCTQSQRASDGYVANDVRLLILRHGVIVTPNTDARITLDGETYLVMTVDEDTLQIYWDCRARLAPQ